MGAGHKALPSKTWSKALLVVPVILCLAILWQTLQLVSLLLMLELMVCTICSTSSNALQRAQSCASKHCCGRFVVI